LNIQKLNENIASGKDSKWVISK